MSTPQPAQSGPPLRALAMVLIALAIAFAGIGAMTLSDSDSDAQTVTEVVPSVAPVSAVPNSPGASARPTTTTIAPTTIAASSGVQAAAAVTDKSSVQVRVFNNSTVSGLAADTTDTLESNGWTVSETGNYSEGTVPKTTVYYRDGSASEKAAAQEIAGELGVTAEERFSGIESASPGVIVIVTES